MEIKIKSIVTLDGRNTRYVVLGIVEETFPINGISGPPFAFKGEYKIRLEADKSAGCEYAHKNRLKLAE